MDQSDAVKANKPSLKKIPSKIYTSKPRGQVIPLSGAEDAEKKATEPDVSGEDTSSDSEKSTGSTCSGSCGKLGGCTRKEKEKVASLEF